MFAVKLKGQITPDRQLRVKLPKDIAPGAVEVIVLHEAPPEPARTPKRRTRRKAAHPAFGLWAKREDIPDSAEVRIYSCCLARIVAHVEELTSSLAGAPCRRLGRVMRQSQEIKHAPQLEGAAHV